MNLFHAEFDTHSAAETIITGHTLGSSLQPGLSLLLRGDLGAGKTTLVKGLATALCGVDPEEITSPTFSLIHEYRGSAPSTIGKVALYHLDLYRLDDERQLAALGLEELRNDPSAILLIEWGEKFPSVAAFVHGAISLTHQGDDSRHIVAHWQLLQDR